MGGGRAAAGPALRAHLLLACLVLGCLLVGACSSGEQTSLATVGGTPPGQPTTAVSPRPSTSTTAAPPTGSKGLPTTATTQAQPLPASISGEAKAAAEAYVAYWRYITTAGSDPKGTDVPATVGAVATGEAAARVVAQLSSWAQQDVHLVGTLKVSVGTATASGASARVCGLLQDLTVTADASGKPTRPLVPSTASQSGTLTKSGPAWRVSAMKEVKAC